MTEIQALETTYGSVRFRSRLEARWAVFFDRVGIPWEYEPDGFQTSAGPYLPDFRVRIPQPEGHGHGEPHYQWFEVKPETFRYDPRHLALATESGHPLIVARGMPRTYLSQLGEVAGGGGHPLEAYLESGIPLAVAFYVPLAGDWVMDQRGTVCGLGDNRIWEQGSHDELTLTIVRHWCTDDGGTRAPCRSTAIDRAYEAARSARFGH